MKGLANVRRVRARGCPGPAFFRAVAVAFSLLLLFLAGAGCFSPRGGDENQPPLGGPEYSALVVSSDLAKGRNRLIFALVNRDNVPVGSFQAEVTARYTPPGAAVSEERGRVQARFIPWPPEGSNRGVYEAFLDFDVPGDATAENPGLWELDISTTTPGGANVETTTAVRVAEASATPAIGAAAPMSVTPTVNDAEDLSQISSAHEPDAGLYALSVHEALREDRPLVVLFSTPAFCVSATCGPQLDILGELRDRYGDRANFIHVEVFEDPHLIEGNRLAAQQVPAVKEWGLPTEPWTFIVDINGKVSAKFEQFTPIEVLEQALEETL